MQKNFYAINTLLQLFNLLLLSKVKYLLRSISNIPGVTDIYLNTIKLLEERTNYCYECLVYLK